MRQRSEPDETPMGTVEAFMVAAAVNRGEDVAEDDIIRAERTLGRSLRPYGGDAA